jgi:hypothetical protein
MLEEAHTCQRCHRELTENEKSETLCCRCQDVLEFGYPSFPFYQLEEESA